jgi:Na+/proline symporter
MAMDFSRPSIFDYLDSIRETFPNIGDDKIGHDLAYPAMLTLLPSGLLGLVLASLVSAYMSTISTHLNWGSSYVVNDFYKALIGKNITEKKLVNVGRISVVFLMIISSLIALVLNNALQLFQIILMFGAGTGSIFILRWFWWRINAWSEISAMICSGIISVLFEFTPIGEMIFSESLIQPYFKFPIVVLITTFVWVSVTFMTKPDDDETLIKFYKKTNPGGPGWKRIKTMSNLNSKNLEKEWIVPSGILCMILGCFAIYSALFSTGYFIYGELVNGFIFLISTIVFSFSLFKISKKIL